MYAIGAVFVFVVAMALCPSAESRQNDGPNPYCDKVSDEYMRSGGVCHDRKDASDITGLFTCNDGTHKTDWRDCEDATAIVP
jgi:hypothetical protein